MLTAISILFCALSQVNALGKPQIRGISPDQVDSYTPDKNGFFSCLSDPSIKIPFSRVNDNYCDCPDGSDEPGTSACENGQFWCPGMNDFISSRYVDDGNCDYFVCCDGSDEKPGLCENRCEEVHAELARRREEEEASIQEAQMIHEQLIEEALENKNQLEVEHLSQLAQKQQIAEEIRAKRVELKRASESDPNNLGDRESVEILKDLHSTLMSAQTEFNELLDDMNALHNSYRTLHAALSKMSVDYNPNFNDPAVKEAINAWKSTPEMTVLVPPFHDYSHLLDSIAQVKVAQREDLSAEEIASMEMKHDEFSETDLDSDDILIERLQNDADDSVAVKALKDSINHLVGKTVTLDREIFKNEKLLKLDDEFFGPNEVGRPMADTCERIKKGDFIYNVCFFGTATQRNGRYTVKLGTSKGLTMRDNNAVIRFEGGDLCDNGVRRHTKVILRCGKKNVLESANELEFCSYIIRGTSPLACAPQEIIHDEL